MSLNVNSKGNIEETKFYKNEGSKGIDENDVAVIANMMISNGAKYGDTVELSKDSSTALVPLDKETSLDKVEKTDLSTKNELKDRMEHHQNVVLENYKDCLLSIDKYPQTDEQFEYEKPSIMGATNYFVNEWLEQTKAKGDVDKKIQLEALRQIFKDEMDYAKMKKDVSEKDKNYYKTLKLICDTIDKSIPKKSSLLEKALYDIVVGVCSQYAGNRLSPERYDKTINNITKIAEQNNIDINVKNTTENNTTYNNTTYNINN